MEEIVNREKIRRSEEMARKLSEEEVREITKKN